MDVKDIFRGSSSRTSVCYGSFAVMHHWVSSWYRQGTPQTHLATAAIASITIVILACSDSGPGVSDPPEEPAVASLTLDPSEIELLPGDTVRLTATPRDAGGNPVAGITVIWSSSDNQIATVESTGLVTGVGLGAATITARVAGTEADASILVLEQIISNEAVVVDSTHLRLIGDSADIAAGILRFEITGDSVPSVERGDILVGAQGPGFLRRVTSTSRTANTITVETSPAGLDEVIERGGFQIEMTLDLSPAAGVLVQPTGVYTHSLDARPREIAWGEPQLIYLAPGATFAPGGIPLDNLNLCAGLLKGGCPPGFELLVTSGSMDFKPELTIEADFWPRPEISALATGTLSMDVEVLLSAVSEFEAAGERPLAAIGVPFVVMVGVVPVVGRVRLSLIVGFGAAGDFSAELRTGVRAQHTTTVGGRYQLPGGWEAVFDTELDFGEKPTLWSGTATTQGRVYVRPEIALELYGSAAAGVHAEPYLTAQGTLNVPDWRLRVFGGLGAGFRFEPQSRLCLFCPTFERELLVEEWLLVDMSGTTEPQLTVRIEAPDDGDAFEVDEAITFRGFATDPEEGTLPANVLSWSSSLDGLLGTGSPLTRSDVSVGTHGITLTATNAQGETASDGIEITVMGAGTIGLGDTISGSIAGSGDVNEYTFWAEAGQEVAAFIQGLTGSSSDWFELRLLDRAGTADETVLGRMAHGRGNWSSLTDVTCSFTACQSTGRVTLPRTDTYTIRIQGRAEETGAYRFLVHPVDRAPESVAAQIAVGDTIQGESIDPPGDIDEFTFQGDAGQEVAAFIQGLTGSSSDWFELRLLDWAGTADETVLGRMAHSRGNWSSLTDVTCSFTACQSTGRVRLPRTGTYTIRIQGPNDRTDSGPYRFYLHPVDRAPESVAAQIAVGDTIQGESIDPPGDIDEFTFQGDAGQEVAAFIQGLTGSSSDWFELRLLDWAGTADETVLGRMAHSRGNWSSLTDVTCSFTACQSTGRVRLPRTGTYTIRIQGPNDRTDSGPYRFYLHPVDRAPESVAAQIAVGDTIQGESIDPPGDIDEFTFQGAAGQEVVVFLQGVTGSSSDRFELRLLHRAATGDEAVLGNVVDSRGDESSLENRSTGAVTLPESTTYTVRIEGRDGRTDSGAYRFHVRDSS